MTIVSKRTPSYFPPFEHVGGTHSVVKRLDVGDLDDQADPVRLCGSTKRRADIPSGPMSSSRLGDASQ
jgi:hypothetical protein